MNASPRARHWFARQVLLAHPQRFCEYLLQCPSAEVRSAFVKILVFLAHRVGSPFYRYVIRLLHSFF